LSYTIEGCCRSLYPILIEEATRNLPSASGQDVTVTFQLQNTGKVAGAEVAQVYLGFPSIDEGNEPPHQLKAFEKVYLQPGESRIVRIVLNPRAFSYWSIAKHGWVIAPGPYKIMIGASVEDIRLEVSKSVP
jgi:beta-glucosidase